MIVEKNLEQECRLGGDSPHHNSKNKSYFSEKISASEVSTRNHDSLIVIICLSALTDIYIDSNKYK